METVLYDYVMETKDYGRIEKLLKIRDKSPIGFWSEVRKLTRLVKSDHAIHRWQILAEARFRELRGEVNE